MLISDAGHVNNVCFSAYRVKMSDEQRSAIKFCVQNGFSKSKTIDMLLNAYGEKAIKKAAVYMWYKRFKEGRENIKDDHPVAVQTSSRIAAVKQLLDNDPGITTRDIVAETDYSYGTVSGIIHNQLNMRRICALWIPKMLNTDQKRLGVECCEQLLKRFKREEEKFMDRIVTVDETWISLYRPETKVQSMTWKTTGSPSPKKFKMSQSTKKQMLVVFFERQG